MTIHFTAYDTTVCRGYQIKRIVEAIQDAEAKDWIPTNDNYYFVTATRGISGNIPAFNHPMYVGKDPLKGIGLHDDYRAMLAVDVRPAVRYDDVKVDYPVTNPTLYKHRMYRAALNSIWLSQGPAAVKAITPMACGVFASWVGETVGRRYGLDPKTQYDLTILAAILYMSNHVEGLEFDKMQEGRSLAAIATSLHYELSDVTKAYDSVKLITSIEDFCNKAKSYLNNVRLEELNHGILVALMGGTWHGDGGIETAGVALEHPPTWLSMLLESYSNKMMSKSVIGKICERRQYKDGLDNLVRSVKSLAPGTTETINQKVK